MGQTERGRRQKQRRRRRVAVAREDVEADIGGMERHPRRRRQPLRASHRPTRRLGCRPSGGPRRRRPSACAASSRSRPAEPSLASFFSDHCAPCQSRQCAGHPADATGEGLIHPSPSGLMRQCSNIIQRLKVEKVGRQVHPLRHLHYIFASRQILQFHKNKGLFKPAGQRQAILTAF